MNNIQYYNLLAIIALILCIIMATMAVVIWFKLEIKHNLAILSGSEARKSISKIKRDAESGAVQADRRSRGSKAVISWNTSGDLDDYTPTVTENPGFTNETTGNPKATTVLRQGDVKGTTVLQKTGSKETTLLGQSGFVVERELVNKSDNSKDD